MTSSKVLLVIYIAMLCMLPYIITAEQEQQPITALIVPFQNLPKNGSESDPIMATLLLSMHNANIMSKKWVYFSFGVLLGGALAIIVGVILFFCFGRKKISETLPYFEAQDKSFHGDHVLEVKKI
ncbi:unnamed protein product [Amaranthus hypochondriacus]